MLKYFVSRTLALIPKLLIITMIIFAGLQLIPGDPISYRFPPDLLAKLDSAQIAQYREAMGLNSPIHIQYIKWLGGLLHGDFGYSLVSGASIQSMLRSRLPATAEIALLGLIISTFFGISFGLISAVRQNSPIDRTFTALSVVGLSVPEFFIALCGLQMFALRLQILPSGGRVPPGGGGLIDRIPYLVMPSVFLGIALIATLMRYTRGSMLDVVGRDFVKLARSKGIAEWKVYIKHAFRNAVMPVVLLLCFRLPLFVGGAVVIENVFNYPGMGTMMTTALSGSDYPVIMIATLLTASITLVASVLVDLMAAMLDPRIWTK